MSATPPPRHLATTKTINLALQGGGSHGAYTWGVLDRLLDDERIVIEGVTGTSAGAMNAAMLAAGFAKGGREGARAQLAEFWRRISENAMFGPFHKWPWERFLTGWNMDLSPSYLYLDMLSRMVSPYIVNPLNFNPLKILLDDMLDIETLQACSAIKLFIAATHVESGQPRVFQCDEITSDVLLASACIPLMSQAIEIDGEHYWDGGYMGNPVIWPLIYHCNSSDVLLVQINPIHREGLPRTSMEIINRMNEINFNSSLIAEMRAIDFVKRLLADGRLEADKYTNVLMHVVQMPWELAHLNASSKVNAGWDFFCYLFDMGRETADAWIAANFDKIGQESSVNIREKFLGGPRVSSHTPKEQRKAQEYQKEEAG